MSTRGNGLFRSFEWRLLAILLMALAPFFIRDTYGHFEARQRTLDAARKSSLELAGSVALQHQELVEGARRYFYLLSLQDQIHGDSAACSETLAKVVHGTGFFKTLVRVDLSGKLTCSAEPGVASLPEEARSALDRVLENATFACGNGAWSGASQQAVLPMGAPLFDDRGRVTGALVGEIGLDWFSQGMTERGAPPDAVVAVTDETGLILAVWPSQPDYVGRRWQAVETSQALKAPGETVADGVFLDGAPRLVAQAAYENGLRAVVAVDRAAVLSAANRRFYSSLALSGLILLVVLVLVRLVARRLLPSQGAEATGEVTLPAAVDAAGQDVAWTPEPGPEEPPEPAAAGSPDDLWPRVIDGLPVGVYAKAVKNGYRYTVWNARMEELFGNRREEVLGRTDFDLLPNRKEAEHNRQVEESVMRSGRPSDQGEEKLTTKLGPLVVHSIRVPLYDEHGRPEALLGLVQEPAQTMAVAEDEARTVALHRLATRHLPNGALIMFDRHLRVTLTGGVGLAEMGLSHEPVEGKNIRQLFVPRISAVLERLCLEALEGRAASDDLVFGEKTSLARAWPLQDDSGRVYAGLILTQDITDLKIRETATLQARESAEEANRAKSRFLARIAQDISSPMNTVVNMTEKALQANPSPRQRDYLEQARESARLLLALVSDLQDLAMIEAGTLQLETVDFELYELMASAVRGLEAQAVAKGLTMTLHLAEDVPRYLLGDPGRLGQIMANLIGNAVKYTKKGGVEVTVRRLPEPEQAELQNPPPAGSQVLLFSVKDTGRGIPAEKLNDIFNGFRPVDGSSARQFGGTGLGLAICGQLIELMGGRMWVESKVGRGSVFYATAIFKPGNPKQVPATQMSLAFEADWALPLTVGSESASAGDGGPEAPAPEKTATKPAAATAGTDLRSPFWEDYPVKMKRLKEAALVEDWHRAADLARSLSGEAGLVGTIRGAELAAELEKAFRGRQSREVNKLLAELEQEMEAFRSAAG